MVFYRNAPDPGVSFLPWFSIGKPQTQMFLVAFYRNGVCCASGSRKPPREVSPRRNNIRSASCSGGLTSQRQRGDRGSQNAPLPRPRGRDGERPEAFRGRLRGLLGLS